jgi:hypothetical protein
LQNEIPAPTRNTPQTGPRTPNGKAVASRNATRHGIMSPHPVIIETMETIEDWEAHLDGIVANLAPEGALEDDLARRIAALLWRLRRVTRFESAVINHHIAATLDDLRIADAYLAPPGKKLRDPDPLRIAAHKEKRVVPEDRDIDKIIRYEAHLHRQCLQTLHELEAIQARRRGEQTHLARLDISSPPVMRWPAAR